MEVAVILFENFETLDVFGPIGILGRLVDFYSIRFYSLHGGQIGNHHGVSVLTSKLKEVPGSVEVFLIPGGIGTRREVDNAELIGKIKEIAEQSNYVLTVCTGSALLARSGLLDAKRATSNKRAFAWAASNGKNVQWDKKARWTVDGKMYTSSGVSAGIDMTLGFLADRHGIDFAREIAHEIEYHWIEESDNDTFEAE